MKKTLIIVFIIIAVLALGAVSMLYFAGIDVGGGAKIETVLPQNPLIYVNVSHLSENINVIQQTEFFKKLTALDYEKLLKLQGITAQQIATIQQFKTQMAAPEARMILDKFFGQEIAFAFYAGNIEKIDITTMSKLLSNVFLVTRLKPQAQFAEFATGYIKQFSEEVMLEEIEYKNEKIRIVKSADGQVNVGYTRLGNLLIVGMGDNAAKSAIDVYTGEAAALEQDKDFLRAKVTFLDKPESFGYLNFARAVTTLKDQVIKWAAPFDNQEAVAQQIENNLKQVKGITSFGYSANFDRISKLKIDWHFNKQELDPITRGMYECTPKENRTSKLVPTSAMVYQWSSCHDFKYYWEQMMVGMGQVGDEKAGQPAVSPTQVLAGVEQNLGLSIENDLIPILGDEFGGYLTDIVTGGPFPIPKLLLFLEIKNKDKLNQIINALFEMQPLFIPAKEQYKNETIHFINIPLVNNLSPGYCLLDNYFIFASNHEMIKQSLDIQNGDTPSIQAHPKMQEYNFDLTKQVNSVFFVNVAETSGKANGLIDWANQWNAMQQSKQQAFRAGSEKRRDDIKNQMYVVQAELDVLREDLQALQNSQDATVEDLEAAAAEQLSKVEKFQNQIEEKEQMLIELEGTQAELDEILNSYDEGQERSFDNQKAIAEEFLKPLMDAFVAFKIFATKVMFGNGVIESLTYWEIQ